MRSCALMKYSKKPEKRERDDRCVKVEIVVVVLKNVQYTACKRPSNARYSDRVKQRKPSPLRSGCSPSASSSKQKEKSQIENSIIPDEALQAMRKTLIPYKGKLLGSDKGVIAAL